MTRTLEHPLVFLWLGKQCVSESFHLYIERNNCSKSR